MGYVQPIQRAPFLNLCTRLDTVLSVCLNQQLQLDDLVAQCVSKVLTEGKFCCSLPWFPGLYEHNFHNFTIYSSNCIFAYIIYTLAVRITKLRSRVMPLRSACTLQSNRFKSALCRKKMWVVHLKVFISGEATE